MTSSTETITNATHLLKAAHTIHAAHEIQAMVIISNINSKSNGNGNHIKPQLYGCMQVIVVESEKETGGFLAPSITILPRKGWKGNATIEECQIRLSKLNSVLFEKKL